MIDKCLKTKRSHTYFTVAVVLFCLWGCVPHNKKTMMQHQEQLDTLYSFLLDERLRDSLRCFIKDSFEFQNDSLRRLTIFSDITKDNVEISFFTLNSFAYTIDRSVFLGAPKDSNDPIIVFCKGGTPSFIDVTMLDYNKGLEYLGMDSLFHIWDDVKPLGSWKKYRLINNGEPQLIDSGYLGK